MTGMQSLMEAPLSAKTRGGGHPTTALKCSGVLLYSQSLLQSPSAVLFPAALIGEELVHDFLPEPKIRALHALIGFGEID